MTTLKSVFTLGGVNWQPAQIEALAYQRNLHILHSMKQHGLAITDSEKKLSDDDIDYLTAADAWRVSIANRANYTGNQIIKAYKASFEKSDDMWRHLGFDQHQPMKVSRTVMQVEGVSLQAFMTIMQAMQQDETVGLSVHPEHFQAIMNQAGIVGIEPFGMFGTPTLVHVDMLQDSALSPAILADKDPAYPMTMAGTAFLADGTTAVNVPYHQFKPTETGFEAKLAVYWPAGVAQEVVSGHELHLATEFYYGLKQITDKA
jgi:hypothetical protein